MPLPTPRDGESRADFMSRCIPAIAGEYDDNDQRVAICSSQWADRGKSMPVKTIDRDALLATVRRGDSVEGIVRKAEVADAEVLDNRRVRFTISSASVDRDNDTINQTGWKTDNYQRNPVVLWAHDYSSLPLGKSVDLSVENGNLKSTVEFADHPFADTVYRLVKGGFLNATSVGFRPMKLTENVERGGLDFGEQELLEYSIVPVPANPDALIEARAAGIDTEPIRKWAETVLTLAHVKVLEGQVSPTQGDDREYAAFKLSRAFAKSGSREPVDHDALANGVDDPIRWNRSWSKAFDVDGEPVEPSRKLYGWVSRYLSTPIKSIYETSISVGGAKLGAFLCAFDEQLAGFTCDAMRNISGGQESPLAYETIQLSSTKAKSFLVEGIRFLQAKGDGSKMVVKVTPSWYGLSFTFYTNIDTQAAVDTTIGRAFERAAQYKFLKGEAFSLAGEFLTRGDETWEDLFLAPANLTPIKRTTKLIADQGADMESRGQILMGPPGTGKTLAGRVIMNACPDATFIWCSSRDFARTGFFGGIEMAYDLARENAPSILFIEDIDSWWDSYAVDLLKTELDGLKKQKGVVTILTTNHPESLPDALIDRPGRFHDVLQLDLPTEVIRREMLTKWAPAADGTVLDQMAKQTTGFSGAHLRELVRFAAVMVDQDGITLNAALPQALAKVREQREIIDAARGRATRRSVKMFDRFTKWGHGICDRCGCEGRLATGVCGECAAERVVGRKVVTAVPGPLPKTVRNMAGDIVPRYAKSGRVLSAENETELRQARDIIDRVLAKVAVGAEEKDDSPPTCCACNNPAQSSCVHGDCTHMTCDQHRNDAGFCPHHADADATTMPGQQASATADIVLALVPSPTEEIVIRLDDDAPSAARIAVTPEDLHAAMRDAFSSLRSDVNEVVRRETAAAFNRARGRVD